jgi:hypothetical protein
MSLVSPEAVHALKRCIILQFKEKLEQQIAIIDRELE